MIRKFLVFALFGIFSSCAPNENRINFGFEKSNIGNLSFKDIKNVKEYKSCTAASLGFIGGYFKIFSSPFYSSYNGDEKYEILKQTLVENNGDSSISSSVKLGGITKIKMIDHTYSITGILSREYCIIVYGE